MGRFAAVARVTEDRWVACRTVDEVNFGLNDSATDEAYCNHPIALKFGIFSYASIPFHRSNGSFFGTLCAIDTEPRDVKHPRAVAMLEMFADLIGRTLETEERLEAQELQVEYERNLARVHEEFVAVLGHDLRNPVAALFSGFRLLSQEEMPAKAQKLLPLIQASVRRMDDLINNIMLHAKARLGGGIRISATGDAPLTDAITQVVEGVRAAVPERNFVLDLSFDRPVKCDEARVAQAVSNLLSNAIRYGAAGTPVQVTGGCNENGFTISVANQGDPVPEELRQDLFHPFRRGNTSSEGLGLGLYIASSIALAHAGKIDFDCKDDTTTFVFRAP